MRSAPQRGCGSGIAVSLMERICFRSSVVAVKIIFLLNLWWSVSKSIAKVIGAYRQEDGYLEGGDCVVSWCLGHLAEYAAPEHYDERYENWRFEDLPILPAEWKLLVHNTKKPQFNVLRKLLRSKKFDYVVNACDAG